MFAQSLKNCKRNESSLKFSEKIGPQKFPKDGSRAVSTACRMILPKSPKLSAQSLKTFDTKNSTKYILPQIDPPDT